jgi:hypothetical protein
MYPIGYYATRSVREEVAHSDTKRSGEPKEMKGGAVPQSALNAAHVASTNARSVG